MDVSGARAAVALLLAAGLASGCAGGTAGTPAPSSSSSAGSGVSGSAVPAASPIEPPATPDARVEEALSGLASDADMVGQVLLLTWTGSDAGSARQRIELLRPAGLLFTDNASTAGTASTINLGLDAIADGAGVMPLLATIEHEGGTSQHLTDVADLGSNGDFARSGATEEDACVRGSQHAQLLRESGFDMDLAPVLEIDTGVADPPLGDRSYGSAPRVVARLGAAYVRGLQAGGIAAVGRSFPGHGRPSTDAPNGPPVIDAGRQSLLASELLPFRRAAASDTGIAVIAVSHVTLPHIDGSGATAALSRAVMGGLLRDELGFRGVIVAEDVASVPAAAGSLDPGQAAIQAINAGADLLIATGDLATQQAIRDALVAALASGSLGRERLVEAVRHVLALKARFGILGGAANAEVGC